VKHTIGKFYTTDKPSDIGRVYASDGELVATVHQTKDKRIQENTRLFVAAPELLEAARELVDHLSTMEGGKWLNNRPGELLEAAIAKAEGK